MHIHVQYNIIHDTTYYTNNVPINIYVEVFAPLPMEITDIVLCSTLKYFYLQIVMNSTRITLSL